jgi:LPXTG-site transpeptidase (sortase) family protein
MNTNRIFLDDNAISGRLRSNWTPRSAPEQRSRPVTSWRRDYSGMIGQDMVRLPAKQHEDSGGSMNNPERVTVVTSTPVTEALSSRLDSRKIPADSDLFSERSSSLSSVDVPTGTPPEDKLLSASLKPKPEISEVFRKSSTTVVNDFVHARPNTQAPNQPNQISGFYHTPTDHKEAVLEQYEPVSLASSSQTSTLAKQFNLEVSTTKSNRHKASGVFGKVARSLTTVVATVVFVAGIYVVVDGYRANKQVKVQLQQVSAAVDSGGAVPEGFPSETSPTESIENYQVAADMPRFLEIPSLGIKSRVIRMGVTPEGAIQAPSNVFDSGWYDGSSKPGEAGASFVDGHVSGFTQPGVFKNIKSLNSGDLISVEMGNATKYQYKVVKIESYPADSVDMNKALAPVTPGKQGLNLMTCNGSFDNATNEYKERLVVFTERIQ